MWSPTGQAASDPDVVALALVVLAGASLAAGVLAAAMPLVVVLAAAGAALVVAVRLATGTWRSGTGRLAGPR
jgi:hypothetical protein